MDNIIETKYGKIAGVDHDSYLTYFGIPYAKAPVGELRFEAPQEAEAYDGILSADHFREKAIQQELGNLELWGKEFYQNPEYNVPASEDCLYLNIWTPKSEESKNCPVAVWIHGGAFKNGYASEMEFDGRVYAERGIILVTIAYRCNLFGFLPTPGEGKRTNLGLRDQLQALKWVKENIASFGGNPDNITLFGQSAGAMSALFLANSPYSEGLFCKAIFQSGAGYRSGVGELLDKESAEQVYSQLLQAAGCKSLQELKKIPAMELYNIFDGLPKMQEIGILAPIIDNDIVPLSTDDSISQGKMLKLPYMMGANKDDLWMEISTAEEPNGELWEGTCRLGTELEKQGCPVYLYYFAHNLPGNGEGAFHSAELWYTFGTLDRSWRPMTDEDYSLSKEMIDCWASFMKSGNPNADGTDKWGRWPENYRRFI